MRFGRRLFTIIGLWLMLGVSAFAAPPAAATLGADDQAELARLRDYLDAIRTLKARFIQVASNGNTVEGDVFLSRPGKLRFQYDPPTPILVISDGWFLGYYDLELEQANTAPLGSTPLSFLLRENISFSDGVTVTALERRPGTVRVTLVKTEDVQQGSITLTFNSAPLALRQWTVVDSQGQSITLSLLNPRLGEALPPKLFHLIDASDLRNLRPKRP